jgi:TP901-1 family phage major tail protein
MATTNVINSTLLAVYTTADAGTTYVKVAHAQDASISLNSATRDITTKDSGGYQELLEGLRSGTMSVSGLYAQSDANGAQALHTALQARTPVVLRFSTQVTGDKAYKATAYITSMELASPSQEDNATFSAEFAITGAWLVETVA